MTSNVENHLLWYRLTLFQTYKKCHVPSPKNQYLEVDPEPKLTISSIKSNQERMCTLHLLIHLESDQSSDSTTSNSFFLGHKIGCTISYPACYACWWSDSCKWWNVSHVRLRKERSRLHIAILRAMITLHSMFLFAVVVAASCSDLVKLLLCLRKFFLLSWFADAVTWPTLLPSWWRCSI